MRDSVNDVRLAIGFSIFHYRRQSFQASHEATYFTCGLGLGPLWLQLPFTVIPRNLVTSSCLSDLPTCQPLSISLLVHVSLLVLPSCCGMPMLRSCLTQPPLSTRNRNLGISHLKTKIFLRCPTGNLSRSENPPHDL
jgi:hypothetical protein